MILGNILEKVWFSLWNDRKHLQNVNADAGETSICGQSKAKSSFQQEK